MSMNVMSVRRATLGLGALFVAGLSLHHAQLTYAVVPMNFTRGTVAGDGFVTSGPTALAMGPDGRLYVADGSGKIQALTIDPTTNAVTAVQQITRATALQEVYGIAFDPSDASATAPI